MIIKPRCKHCGNFYDVLSEGKLGKKTIQRLSCGHTRIVEDVRTEAQKFLDEFHSDSRGHLLYAFQKIGAQFAVDSGLRCLIADDMGLGKTVQALAAMAYSKKKKVMIVTKARLREQWTHAFYDWVGEEYGLVRIIREPKIDKPWPDVCPITIVSYTSLPLCPWLEDTELLKQHDLLIFDETQQISNREAKRTKAAQYLAMHFKHIIGLSGTPVKNNAGEYFTILNILRPDLFHNYNRFLYDFVDSYDSGPYVKLGGISGEKWDRFHSLTKKFIIRRTMDEVLPDLPKIRRSYNYHELGEKVKEAYDNLLKEFMERVDAGEKVSFGGGLLAQMVRMRYLTGIAKVEPTMEFIEEFLLTTNRKIAISCHHDDVLAIVANHLKQICKDGGFAPPIDLSGVKAEDTFQAIEEFRKPENRIILLKTLMHGEGLNLQFCSDAILLEREWNPANEEQLETRFRRIGSEAGSVNITYPVATGTIDEFLAEIVEKKRDYMASTLDGKEYKWEESSIMQQLADKLYEQGSIARKQQLEEQKQIRKQNKKRR